MTSKLKKELFALRTNPRFKYIRLVEYYASTSPATYGFGAEEYTLESWDAFETNVNDLLAATQEKLVKPDTQTAYSHPVSFSIDFCEYVNGIAVSDGSFVRDMNARFGRMK